MDSYESIFIRCKKFHRFQFGKLFYLTRCPEFSTLKNLKIAIVVF